MNESLSWRDAIITCSLRLTPAEAGRSWPDALTPDNIARLQRPYGKDKEKRRLAASLAAELLAAIEAGTLHAEERTIIIAPPPTPPQTRHSALLDRLRGNEAPAPGAERTETVHLVGRAAFRDFLAARSIEPSEHVRAWLAPLGRAEETAEECTPVKRAALVEALGGRYPALVSALDRGDDWIVACRVPDRRGWYFLEAAEAACRARYGGTRPAPVRHDGSAAGQLRSISGK